MQNCQSPPGSLWRLPGFHRRRGSPSTSRSDHLTATHDAGCSHHCSRGALRPGRTPSPTRSGWSEHSREDRGRVRRGAGLVCVYQRRNNERLAGSGAVDRSQHSSHREPSALACSHAGGAPPRCCLTRAPKHAKDRTRCLGPTDPHRYHQLTVALHRVHNQVLVQTDQHTREVDHVVLTAATARLARPRRVPVDLPAQRNCPSTAKSQFRITRSTMSHE
jgi:hypothetical protein